MHGSGARALRWGVAAQRLQRTAQCGLGGRAGPGPQVDRWGGALEGQLPAWPACCLLCDHTACIYTQFRSRARRLHARVCRSQEFGVQRYCPHPGPPRPPLPGCRLAAPQVGRPTW